MDAAAGTDVGLAQACVWDNRRRPEILRIRIAAYKASHLECCQHVRDRCSYAATWRMSQAARTSTGARQSSHRSHPLAGPLTINRTHCSRSTGGARTMDCNAASCCFSTALLRCRIVEHTHLIHKPLHVCIISPHLRLLAVLWAVQCHGAAAVSGPSLNLLSRRFCRSSATVLLQFCHVALQFRADHCLPAPPAKAALHVRRRRGHTVRGHRRRPSALAGATPRGSDPCSDAYCKRSRTARRKKTALSLAKQCKAVQSEKQMRGSATAEREVQPAA